MNLHLRIITVVSGLAMSLRTPTFQLFDKKKFSRQEMDKLSPICVLAEGWDVGVCKLTHNLHFLVQPTSSIMYTFRYAKSKISLSIKVLNKCCFWGRGFI